MYRAVVKKSVFDDVWEVTVFDEKGVVYEGLIPEEIADEMIRSCANNLYASANVRKFFENSSVQIVTKRRYLSSIGKAIVGALIRATEKDEYLIGEFEYRKGREDPCLVKKDNEEEEPTVEERGETETSPLETEGALGPHIVEEESQLVTEPPEITEIVHEEPMFEETVAEEREESVKISEEIAEEEGEEDAQDDLVIRWWWTVMWKRKRRALRLAAERKRRRWRR